MCSYGPVRWPRGMIKRSISNIHLVPRFFFVDYALASGTHYHRNDLSPPPLSPIPQLWSPILFYFLFYFSSLFFLVVCAILQRSTTNGDMQVSSYQILLITDYRLRHDIRDTPHRTSPTPDKLLSDIFSLTITYHGLNYHR